MFCYHENQLWRWISLIHLFNSNRKLRDKLALESNVVQYIAFLNDVGYDIFNMFVRGL